MKTDQKNYVAKVIKPFVHNGINYQWGQWLTVKDMIGLPALIIKEKTQEFKTPITKV